MKIPPPTPFLRSVRMLSCCATVSLLSIASLVNAESLLKNSDLKMEAPDSGQVSSWQLYPKTTPLVMDTYDFPEGAEFSLRVKATEVSPGSNGFLAQRLLVPIGAPKLVLTGYIKSDVPRGAYLQVKLYDDRTELVRLNGDVSSTPSWQKVTIHIDPKVVTEQGQTVTANRVEVLCRWFRQDKHIGNDLWFAKLQLSEE